VSKVLNETYLAICEQSQYVYFRNYMKRVVIYGITLDLPKDKPDKRPTKFAIERNPEGLRGGDRPEGRRDHKFQRDLARGQV
jgi:hypothetical protein